MRGIEEERIHVAAHNISTFSPKSTGDHASSRFRKSDKREKELIMAGDYTVASRQISTVAAKELPSQDRNKTCIQFKTQALIHDIAETDDLNRNIGGKNRRMRGWDLQTLLANKEKSDSRHDHQRIYNNTLYES